MDRDQTAGPPALVRRSSEDWRELVREFEASGETLKAWCAGRGFSSKTLSNWRRRFRSAAPAFVAVPAESGPPPALEVELDLGGGAVLRLRRA